MSPNIDHHLNSYQHCSEHEPLNVDVGNGLDSDGNSAIDVGVSFGHHQSQSNNFDRHASIENSCSSLEVSHRRKKSHAVSFFLFIVALSVGVGWLASDVFSSRRHRNHHIDGGSAELEPDKTNEFINGDIPNLIWSDEFEGDTIDMTKWSFVNGNGCDVGLCGWGNDELQWYTPSNAHVSQGKLILEARKFELPGSPASYTSSKIISRGKADFGVVETSIDNESKSSNILGKSRRFESRLKLPWGHGIWPAFWMLPTYDTYGGWPKSGEIDIMENIGKEGPNTIHGTVHYGLDWPQHQYSESGITLSTLKSNFPPRSSFVGNLNETFHTFAVERSPSIIRWYIDDIEYSSITKEEMMPYRWPFDEEFYFIFNLAVGGNWPGNPDEDSSDGFATTFPQRLEVDYVRVYEGIFPRIVGKNVVDCSEKDVEYEIVNIESEDISYTWEVPQNATIKRGQGTSRIVVNFDSTTSLERNIIDSEIIYAQASGIDNHCISTSIGLAKLQESGIGMRVKIVDFSGKCSSAKKEANTGLNEYNFDCGRPSTCTAFVLGKTTDKFTCGERIEWLINEKGMAEQEACKEVGYKQFHGHCGPCNPFV